MDLVVVRCTGRGLVVKQPGVLSKVQMLNLVLGVFSLPPIFVRAILVNFSDWNETKSSALIPFPKTCSQLLSCCSSLNLVDVSNIFIFFCSGEGKGESRATGRGCLQKILWGGGLNIFFGAEMPTK